MSLSECSIRRPSDPVPRQVQVADAECCHGASRSYRNGRTCTEKQRSPQTCLLGCRFDNQRHDVLSGLCCSVVYSFPLYLKSTPLMWPTNLDHNSYFQLTLNAQSQQYLRIYLIRELSV